MHPLLHGYTQPIYDQSQKFSGGRQAALESLLLKSNLSHISLYFEATLCITIT